MKAQKTNKQIDTVQQLQQNVHNQKLPSHCQNYHRIKQQVHELLNDPPDNFKISVFEQTKIRIVLRIFYFIQQSDILFFEESQHQFGKTIKKNQKQRKHNMQFLKVIKTKNFFFQNQQNQEELEQVQIQPENIKFNIKKYALFTCIIDYDFYPYTPPYLIVTEIQGLSSKLMINDFSNITDNILCDTAWFPSYKLYDILVGVPKFIQKLNHEGATIKSSYYYEKAFKKSDIQQHALGLKIYEGQVYDTKDAFVGKYIKRVIGISFKSLIVFKTDQFTGLKIRVMFPLHEIENLKIEQNDKRIKFKLIFKGKKQISYRFLKDNRKQQKIISQRQRMNCFVNWMKLCIYNAQYENIKKSELISQPLQIKIQKRQWIVVGNNNRTVNCVQNQNSLHNIGKQIVQQRDSKKNKQQRQKLLITKQQKLVQILQVVDLLVSSVIYRRYSQQQMRQGIQQRIYLDENRLVNEQMNINEMTINKLNNNNNKSRIKDDNNIWLNRQYIKNNDYKQDNNNNNDLDIIDLIKNEYNKLKIYKQRIQRKRKQLFMSIS